MSTRFKPGDFVIYRKHKQSVRPGPNAREIHPAPNGDYYSYEVDKFWRVIGVLPDHKIVVGTRRGKQLTLDEEDPALRCARWWERWFFRHRFPVPTNSSSVSRD